MSRPGVRARAAAQFALTVRECVEAWTEQRDAGERQAVAFSLILLCLVFLGFSTSQATSIREEIVARSKLQPPGGPRPTAPKSEPS